MEANLDSRIALGLQIVQNESSFGALPNCQRSAERKQWNGEALRVPTLANDNRLAEDKSC
jgi:hypothetical protein